MHSQLLPYASVQKHSVVVTKMSTVTASSELICLSHPLSVDWYMYCTCCSRLSIAVGFLLNSNKQGGILCKVDMKFNERSMGLLLKI